MVKISWINALVCSLLIAVFLALKVDGLSSLWALATIFVSIALLGMFFSRLVLNDLHAVDQIIVGISTALYPCLFVTWLLYVIGFEMAPGGNRSPLAVFVVMVAAPAFVFFGLYLFTDLPIGASITAAFSTWLLQSLVATAEPDLELD